MAVERSLARCGTDHFDLLLLHNPDRRGFESPEVWEALRGLRDEGLTHELGVAPGPANGFTLDVIGCLERYGELIDWAMLILNPFEPWPGELPLEAARTHGVRVITRVVDYGGLFHDDVLPGHRFADHDHRGFRPDGWVEAGRAKLERLRPIADRHGLTPLQLSCAWNLAHDAVECVAPTLIQEAGPDAKPIEDKRAELASVPAVSPLSADEVDEIRRIGDNSGSMLLKGATPDHDGEERPDRWSVGEEQAELARRWGIDPERDLRRRPVSVGR
jgi:aryl-alcohol dehydrogenase-like predicted oxidoreductase